jgi:hypothetical protein
MALGLVLIAMIGATAASLLLFLFDFSIWIVLLAYPVTGALILLPGVALIAWIKQIPPDDQLSDPTSRLHAGPRPQSPPEF